MNKLKKLVNPDTQDKGRRQIKQNKTNNTTQKTKRMSNSRMLDITQTYTKTQ